VLGLPLADRPKFTAWASGFTPFTRIADYEIGGTPFRKQFVRQLAGDSQNARLHFKHGLPATRFVDDTPQVGVIGLVGRQHVVGDCARDFRHPPPKSDDVSVVPSQGECPAVFQDLIGEPLRGGRPNRPDKREPNLDDRPRGLSFSISAVGLRKYS
jgi:hypothetical protein